jgi:hypothetical protein
MEFVARFLGRTLAYTYEVVDLDQLTMLAQLGVAPAFSSAVGGRSRLSADKGREIDDRSGRGRTNSLRG